MKREDKKEFEKHLLESFPLLYKDMGGDPRKTCMAFGISVGPGWWPIIQDLSEKIEAEIKVIVKEKEESDIATCSKCGHAKKCHLPDGCFAGCTCFSWSYDYPRAAQVKEKFAGLRFYMTQSNYDEIEKLIDEAEEKCWKICEECGAPGEVRGKSWIKTYCADCEDKRNRNRR